MGTLSDRINAIQDGDGNDDSFESGVDWALERAANLAKEADELLADAEALVTDLLTFGAWYRSAFEIDEYAKRDDGSLAPDGDDFESNIKKLKAKIDNFKERTK